MSSVPRIALGGQQSTVARSRWCRFCQCGEEDTEEHMLLRCGLHASIRVDLAKACDALVPCSWSGAADDKERYRLLKDCRFQQPMNSFFMKCIRERDSAPLTQRALERMSSMP